MLANEDRHLVCGDPRDRQVTEAVAQCWSQTWIQERGISRVLRIGSITDSKMALMPMFPSPPQMFQLSLNTLT